MPTSFGPLDCGDNSCRFATNKGGMRTNGGCRCLDNIYDKGALAMIERIAKAVEQRANSIGIMRSLKATYGADALREAAKLLRNGELV